MNNKSHWTRYYRNRATVTQMDGKGRWSFIGVWQIGTEGWGPIATSKYEQGHTPHAEDWHTCTLELSLLHPSLDVS